MTIERTEVVWIESRSDYSVHELAELSGLPATFLDALLECGALPVAARVVSRGAPRFASESVVLARAAQGLREHFELDEQGLAVAVALLRRVRALEAELSGAQARSMATVD